MSFFGHYRQWRDFLKWGHRAYAAPSPTFIKNAVLARNGIPKSTWVETGTFRGDTTRLLASLGTFVYTVEPEPSLFSKAKVALRDLSNVEVIHGLSEVVFPVLLPTLTGDVNFWLDGHYSAGETHQGPKDTPILDELAFISTNRENFTSLCVLVDDVRCFYPSAKDYPTYPSVIKLIEWAEELHLHWYLEHDIFIARSDLTWGSNSRILPTL